MILRFFRWFLFHRLTIGQVITIVFVGFVLALLSKVMMFLRMIR